MRNCISCFSDLDKETKPEHILPSAFGGRKTTRKIICSKCNNYFGSSIDKILADQFLVIRNLLKVRSGYGSAPPTMRNIKAGTEVINIDGDGKIMPQSKPFEITNLSNGSKSLSINAPSFESIWKLIPNMAAALGLSEQDLRDQISEHDGQIVEKRPDPIQLSFQFGGSGAFRSAAKSCFVLWATILGNDEASGSCYNRLRSFINGKNDDFLQSNTDLDSRHIDFTDAILDNHGKFFNLIYVKSNESGRVIGHFTLFNLVGFSITLADSGGAPNKTVGLIANPLDGSWSDITAQELDIPFSWLTNPHYDYETMNDTRSRFAALTDYYYESNEKAERFRIIKDVIEGHGVHLGDPLPAELAQSISSEIAARLVGRLMNVPYKKSVDSSKIKQIFENLNTKVDYPKSENV